MKFTIALLFTISLAIVNAFTETGDCSWYGAVNEIPEGHPTACGKPFNRMEMAAAHKTLPCGTKVKVTDLGTGKSVQVVVSDRGPFVAGRIFDFTYGAAQQMGFIDKGIIKCKIETV